MNLGAAAGLPRKPEHGVWHRAIPAPYVRQPLGSGFRRGRFNAVHGNLPPLKLLYFAATPSVAAFEVGAMLGSPWPGETAASNPARGDLATVTFDVTLSEVADLTEHRNLTIMETSVQELTGDWRGYEDRPHLPPLEAPHWTNVPTQRLGFELSRSGELEGFITWSARVPWERVLVVFAERLRPNSRLQASGVMLPKVEAFVGN